MAHSMSVYLKANFYLDFGFAAWLTRFVYIRHQVGEEKLKRQNNIGEIKKLLSKLTLLRLFRL
jgi:hypothetical protein